MAKRNKYQEMAARILYEHTDLNKTVFQLQESCREVDKTLVEFQKKLREKPFLKKEKKKEVEKDKN
jgi:hypothetical protein